MKFACSHCHQRFDVPEHWEGRTIQCTRCEEFIVVPAQTEELPPAAEPPPSPPAPAPAPAEPPPPAQTRRLPLALLLPGYTILLGMGVFGFVAASNQESPRQTWRRFTALVGKPLVPTPAPPPPPSTPGEVAPPIPVAPSVAAPSPADTSAPPLDALAWLADHKSRWPKEVTLLKPEDFPAVFNDKVVGSVSIPAGSAVAVVEITPREVVVASPGGASKRLPAAATTLPELARLEMARPEPPLPSTPVPAPPPAGTAPPPTPTPASTPPPKAEAVKMPNYFGSPVDGFDEETDPAEKTPEPRPKDR